MRLGYVSLERVVVIKLVALHSTASAPGLRPGSAPRAHSSKIVKLIVACC